jgi:hypothetical protein
MDFLPSAESGGAGGWGVKTFGPACLLYQPGGLEGQVGTHITQVMYNNMVHLATKYFLRMSCL